MANKKYDPSLLTTYDKPGKETVRKLLEEHGYLVAYNPNEYLGDLIILEKTDDGYYRKVAIGEVGVRPSWNSHRWPKSWETIRIEQRKGKYTKEDLPVWYFVLNKDQTAVMILDKDLLQYPVKKSSNRYMKDEDFYFVPAIDCEFVELKSQPEEEI